MTTLHGLITCLLYVLHVSEAAPAISVGAAAASGAIFAAGVGGGGRERYRDEDAEARDFRTLYLFVELRCFLVFSFL